MAYASATVRRLLIACLMLVVGALGLGASSGAQGAARGRAHVALRHIPSGFVGINPDGVDLPGVNSSRQLDLMRADGVRSLRVAFYWAGAEPYPDWDAVPASQVSRFRGGPVPTDFAATDQLVAAAASRRLQVLPVVLQAPAWDAVDAPSSMSTPPDVAPYANYMTLLVQRYGPHGTFWSDHPAIPYEPIRQWQIWNEPSLSQFWAIHPWLQSYLLLLGAAHAAVKQVDPGAQVVLAGLTNDSWHAISAIEHVSGARDLFDIAAVHPYTRTPAGVIEILKRFRTAMDRGGDRRKPVLMTEFGWPSALGETRLLYGFEATQSTQASRLDALMPMLARERSSLRLLGFYYYMWMGDEARGGSPFNYAGLFAYHDGSVTAKPVFGVFRRWALAFDGAGG